MLDVKVKGNLDLGLHSRVELAKYVAAQASDLGSTQPIS